MLRTRKSQAVTVIIFIGLILLRLPGMDNSPAEYHSWRQSDTEAIARNFSRNTFNIFYPQLNYDGPLPNYVQLEFQITTFLIAILYRLWGHYYYLARLVPLLFFCGSAYFLYLIGKRIAGKLTGWLALAAYGLFPFCIYFSRAIMPESAALFFMTGGMYYFLVWQDRENSKRAMLLSAVFTALAISQKIPAIYIGLPMACLLFKTQGMQALKNPSAWAYLLVALLPPFLYFFWLHYVAESAFVSGIAARLLFSAWNQKDFPSSGVRFLIQGLPRAYTAPGLGLAAGGLLLHRSAHAWLLRSWALGAALEIFFIAAAIQLDYYLLLAAPIIALLAAVSLEHLVKNSFGRVIIIGLLILLAMTAWQETGLSFREEEIILQRAKVLQENTLPSHLLVIGVYNPELLNLSDRFGWRANIFYPQDKKRELGFFVENRASYFVTVNGQIEGDWDGSYLRLLQENYPRRALPYGVTLYELQ